MFLAFAEYKDQVRFSWQIWCFPFSAEVLLRGPVGIGFVLEDCSTVAVRHFPLLRMLTSLKCTLQPKLQTQFAIAHRFAGWLIVNKLKENKLVIFWTSGSFDSVKFFKALQEWTILMRFSFTFSAVNSPIMRLDI